MDDRVYDLLEKLYLEVQGIKRNMATKDDIKDMVVKDDLKNFATKDDLNNKADKTELHEHSNKSVLDSITQDDIDNWNAKTNEAINNELDEANANITAVADDLDSMDERVLYLEKQENKAPILSFNDNGELVVTINGVSKIFTPKE